MTLYADLEPLIAIAVGIGWFIIKALMSRRDDAAEWEGWDEKPQAPPVIVEKPPERPKPAATPPPPLIQRLPKRGAPPPIVTTTAPVFSGRPVAEVEGPPGGNVYVLKESAESYARGASLHEATAQRMAAIREQTEKHRPASVTHHQRPVAAERVLGMFREPATVRQAMLAAFVLNPPKAIDDRF